MKCILFSGLLLICLFLTGFSSCKKKDKEEPEVPGQVLYNQSYGTDPRHVMDVHLPENRSYDSTKVMIYIHGGDWTGGDKHELTGLLSTFKKYLPGYALIGINYRLCSADPYTNGFPAQEEDVALAVSYIKSKCAEWNISPNHITLTGSSAGGHLALLHAYKNNSDHTIKAVAAFYAPTHLAQGYDGLPASKASIEFVTGGTPSEVPDTYFESSPIHYTSTAIPSILFHGNTDNVIPVQQTMWLADSLNAKGKMVDSWIVPAEGHGFSSLKMAEAIQRIGTFFSTNNP